jgi:DNA-binding NarL/FixJ family response regulator
LLADDHEDIVALLGTILSREFDLVGTVGDGIALLEAAARLQPDAVVADISMPRLDGLSAAMELTQQQPTIKVVLVTMYLDSALADIAALSGAHGLIVKHRAAHELVAAVRAVLGGGRYISPALIRE